MQPIEIGQMVFISEGLKGVGAVRGVNGTNLIIYVENAGDLVVPMSAVRDIHDQKVILDKSKLDDRFLKAIGHAHDREEGSPTG